MDYLNYCNRIANETVEYIQKEFNKVPKYKEAIVTVKRDDEDYIFSIHFSNFLARHKTSQYSFAEGDVWEIFKLLIFKDLKYQLDEIFGGD